MDNMDDILGQIGEDEFADDDTVVLQTPDGEEVEFVEVAGIVHKGEFYAILQPVELLEGMEEDEALVFKVTRDEEGNDHFQIELDDEVITAVFEEYNRLLENATGEDE